jgi:hypothetical protein
VDDLREVTPEHEWKFDPFTGAPRDPLATTKLPPPPQQMLEYEPVLDAGFNFKLDIENPVVLWAITLATLLITALADAALRIRMVSLPGLLVFVGALVFVFVLLAIGAYSGRTEAYARITQRLKSPQPPADEE